jgi:hypothetical protein
MENFIGSIAALRRAFAVVTHFEPDPADVFDADVPLELEQAARLIAAVAAAATATTRRPPLDLQGTVL